VRALPPTQNADSTQETVLARLARGDWDGKLLRLGILAAIAAAAAFLPANGTPPPGRGGSPAPRP
jgi:hypothetical protein